MVLNFAITIYTINDSFLLRIESLAFAIAFELMLSVLFLNHVVVSVNNCGCTLGSAPLLLLLPRFVCAALGNDELPI